VGAGYYFEGAATMIYMMESMILSRVGREKEHNMST
jgi:hypothetical protein